MCKVILGDLNNQFSFIIYNHLFSQNKYKFTIPELIDDLKQYNLEFSAADVEKEIRRFIKSGIVKPNFRTYSICER